MSESEKKHDNNQSGSRMAIIIALSVPAIIAFLMGVAVFTYNIPIIQLVAIFAIILSIVILVYWFKQL